MKRRRTAENATTGEQRHAASRPLPRHAPTGEVPDDGPDELDRGLGDLLDEDRRARAVQELRDRDLRRAADEDTATLTGILRDLGEQSVQVVFEHVGGRTAGRIVAVADDHVVLHRPGDQDVVLLARWAVTTVSPEPGVKPQPSVARRSAPSATTLRDALAEVVPERPEVVLLVHGRDEVLAGTLRAVGEDVITISGHDNTQRRTFVALARVVRAALRP